MAFVTSASCIASIWALVYGFAVLNGEFTLRSIAALLGYG